MHLLTLLAAEGAGHAQDPNLFLPSVLPSITAIVVFGVVFLILATKVWPPIVKALDARNEKILAEIRAAEDAQAKARAAQAEFEKRLAEARDEADRLIRSAKAEAQRQAEDLRARNDAELQENLKRASAEIEAAKRQAVVDIHAQAATLATAIAAKILKREISSGDQQRLVEESLRELAGSRN